MYNQYLTEAQDCVFNWSDPYLFNLMVVSEFLKDTKYRKLVLNTDLSKVVVLLWFLTVTFLLLFVLIL